MTYMRNRVEPSALSYRDGGQSPMSRSCPTLYSDPHNTFADDGGFPRSRMMPLRSWSRSIIPTLFLLALPALSMAQVSVNVSVDVPPPELPVYDQPPIPGDGYIWTPGYWAWSDDVQDYYWVPGTWVLAPEPDYLWTPGYWAANGAVFFWHPGYWGPHVGFYGGVNYGHGYGGEGYEGGYWRGGHLYYNRSVNNIGNTHITNVYNKTVINNVTVNRVSYNGGRGGIQARPSPGDEAAMRERHLAVTSVQRQHENAARSNPGLRVSENKGHPPIAATARPGAFSGAGVVPAAHAKGTMSVIHANPPPRDEQPRSEQPRGEQPRAEQPRAEQPRTEQPEPRAARPAEETRQQRPVGEPRPQTEPRRAPEQAPRQSAPPRAAPRPEESRPAPRPQESRPAPPPRPPAEHRTEERPAPAREENREHH